VLWENQVALGMQFPYNNGIRTAALISKEKGMFTDTDYKLILPEVFNIGSKEYETLPPKKNFSNINNILGPIDSYIGRFLSRGELYAISRKTAGFDMMERANEKHFKSAPI